VVGKFRKLSSEIKAAKEGLLVRNGDGVFRVRVHNEDIHGAWDNIHCDEVAFEALRPS